MKTGRIKGAKSYMLIDNRLSPVPLTQTMPNGEVLTVAAGEVLEAKALSCAHCGSVVVLNPKRVRERSSCRRCNQYICGRPGCRADCLPTDEMVDLALRYPSLPTLERDALGRPLFDVAIAHRHRIH